MDTSKKIYKNLNINNTDWQNILGSANKCLGCRFAPCIKGCPLSVDIPAFIKEVRNKDISKAYKIISKNSLFPRLCAKICPTEKQCEGACVRGKKGDPVPISKIEQFVADAYHKLSNKYTNDKNISTVNSAGQNKKVAIVGSGAAGLSCAISLKKLGYDITIFEKMPKIGGMLFYGIPEFRLKKSILSEEILKLKELGIDIKTGVNVGENLFLEDILNTQKFNAIFLATGTWEPKKIGIIGEDLGNVYNFIEFLTQFNSSKNNNSERNPLNYLKNIAVIGGGNVAVDVARCAKRLKNAKNVSLIYRRSSNEIPANKQDIACARAENINFETLTNVKKIIGNNSGYVKEILCTKNKMLNTLDKNGKPDFSEIENSSFTIPVDAAIICTGSTHSAISDKDPYKKLLCGDSNIIKINENQQSTAIPQIFAGGDLVTGASAVAKAMANGNLVARKIHEYLTSLE